MDVLKSARTAWGKRTQREDVRTLRRYNRLLQTTRNVGEALTVLFSLFTILGALTLLYVGDFENAIINDGTSTNCVLHGTTGTINGK